MARPWGAWPSVIMQVMGHIKGNAHLHTRKGSDPGVPGPLSSCKSWDTSRAVFTSTPEQGQIVVCKFW